MLQFDRVILVKGGSLPLFRTLEIPAISYQEVQYEVCDLQFDAEKPRAVSLVAFV